MKGKHLRSGIVLLAIVLSVVTMIVIWFSLQNQAFAWGPAPRTEAASSAGMGTAFSYQGSLIDSGLPANGSYDLQFGLYDALTAGNMVGSILEVPDVAVTDGIFIVKLDFGANIFTGEDRYLEVGVRPGDSSGAYTPLTPRQELTAVPYALNAATVADGAIMAGNIGEPCALGQVLTSDGGVWTCGGADVEPSPKQQITHIFEIEGLDMANVEVDLLTLGIETEVITYQDGNDLITRKRPGRTAYTDFYMTCTDPDQCDLIDWHQLIVSGDINVPRKDVRIMIFKQGNPLWDWHGFECWPSQNMAQYSPDGSNLTLRFKISCEYFEVDGSSWTGTGGPGSSPARINHRVEIENLSSITWAELSYLDVETEVIEFQSGEELRKRPGRTKVEDFFVYCTDACADIIDWQRQFTTYTYVRASVSIHILAPDGSTGWSWNGGACWPSQHTNQLSHDGLELFPRFKITCETLEMLPTP